MDRGSTESSVRRMHDVRPQSVRVRLSESRRWPEEIDISILKLGWWNLCPQLVVDGSLPRVECDLWSVFALRPSSNLTKNHPRGRHMRTKEVSRTKERQTPMILQVHRM